MERVDPTNVPQCERFYRVYRASSDREFDQPWTFREKHVVLRGDDYQRIDAVLLHSNGNDVAGGWVVMPLRDNHAFAYVHVFTRPEYRRRGYASQILNELEDVVRRAGRTKIIGEAAWDVRNESGPAREFAESRGFTLDLLEAQRQLLLPAALPQYWVPDGYRLQSWREACPEEWLDPYAELRALITQEAPSGDAGLENEYWDAARVRDDELLTAEKGRVLAVAVAIAPSGELAGHTQLIFPELSSEVYQWDTLVLPDHRGLGLGLALKTYLMEETSDLLVGRRRIHTYNAATNQHMIAVNEKLGFHQVAWLGEFIHQK